MSLPGAAGVRVREAAAERGGLAVRVRRVEGAPVVAVRVWFPGGARREAFPGQALVTGRSLIEGSRKRDWRVIGEEAEALGMVLSSFGSFEAHGVTVDALATDWEQALRWAAELAFEPSFPAERTLWVARQTAAELESLGDQPDVRTAWGFLEQLYSPHPRGRPIQGTAESLAALGAADCASFHGEVLSHGAVVAVAGVLEETAVEARVRELFAPLVEGRGKAVLPPTPGDLCGRHREVALEGSDRSDQAHLYAGHLTLPRRHEDYEALELAGVMLGSGSGLTGRIPERIREREGLAYTARARTVAGAGLDPGYLVTYVGTSPATVERAERGVREELARFVEEGFSEAELVASRAYLLGREPFRRETARQWADLMAEASFYGLPVDEPGWRRDRLERLDGEAVLAAVRRHLHPEALRVTVGLPA